MWNSFYRSSKDNTVLPLSSPVPHVPLEVTITCLLAAIHQHNTSLSDTDAVYRNHISGGWRWFRFVHLLVGPHLVRRIVELFRRYLVVDVL